MPVDFAGHDDVAGLFKRLGANAGSGSYHDFSEAVDDLAPLPAPQALNPARAAEVPVPSAAMPDPIAPPAPAQDELAATTPLQQLFLRLAQVPLPTATASPLARLRQR